MDRKKYGQNLRSWTIFIALLCLSACLGPKPSSRPDLLAYQIKDRVNKDFLIIRDSELESYLQSLVFRLISNYGNQISIEIAKNQLPFARSFPGGLVLVSSGLLEICNSESELAFVLAHEFGHVILGHHSQPVAELELTELKARELAADSFGGHALVSAGYSIDGAFSSIQRLTSIWDFYGTQNESGYPSATERLEALQNQLMDQSCLMTGTCLMGGMESSRDFVRFRMRLGIVSRKN